ncbi:MAG: hypothetical protein ACOCRX_09880 [Candidatus Woesearchaeota archaeon]
MDKTKIMCRTKIAELKKEKRRRKIERKENKKVKKRIKKYIWETAKEGEHYLKISACYEVKYNFSEIVQWLKDNDFNVEVCNSPSYRHLRIEW